MGERELKKGRKEAVRAHLRRKPKHPVQAVTRPEPDQARKAGARRNEFAPAGFRVGNRVCLSLLGEGAKWQMEIDNRYLRY